MKGNVEQGDTEGVNGATAQIVWENARVACVKSEK